MVKGGNAFAFDLYAKIRDDAEHKGKNVFFSPISISTALAMTYGGAVAPPRMKWPRRCTSP